MPHSLRDLYQLAVDIYSQIHPIWLWIASAFAGVTAAIAKYKKLVGLYDWCVEKHDGKVLHALSESCRSALVQTPPGQSRFFLPFALSEIASEVKRSEKSVRRTLRRLEDRGAVHEVKGGWYLGRRPEPMTFSNLGRLTASAYAGRGRWNCNRW